MLQRWRKNLNLRTKVMVLALTVTVVSLTGVASVSLVQMNRQIAAEQQHTADSVAMSVARASELALAVSDTRELKRLANTFLRDRNVEFIAIYGHSPHPLVTAARNSAAWEAWQSGSVDASRCMVAQQPVTSSENANEFNPDSLDPLELGAAPPSAPARGAVLGRVVVGLSTQQAVDAQHYQSRLMSAATAAAALVGAVVLFLTLGNWMRRLQRLADASDAISRGDFSASINDTHRDEIGRLAGSFDTMAGALRQRDQALREFTDTLQQKVEQRTTDLRQALAAAEEASRAKSLFLANMSHELRTPLNGVIGMVDLLLAANPNPQQRRYGDVAKASARSLLELINDILDFSKIEANKMDIETADFDLYLAIEDVTQMLSSRAEQKGLELMCQIDHRLPRTVIGDAVRLRQVIANLVSNAIKFTERGEVVIDAELQHLRDDIAVVKVSVRDTGMGIPADRLNRLFKSFSQVDASTTRKFGGTGLGLAISQRIVEMMGGQIGVESREGEGSTFWFTAALKVQTQTAIKPRAVAVDPRGMRVLVVDDNATNREILGAQLSSWNLLPTVASDADQAMKLLADSVGTGVPFQCAILDMQMPRTSGLELARQIKANPNLSCMILIGLGSLMDNGSSRQLSEAGFAQCLTKPALPSQLYDALVNCLSTSSNLAAAHPPPVTPPKPQLVNITGARILLAEDNEVNRMVASELLEQAGCQCTMVTDGRQALTEALRGEYDVILMDCQMPEMDGFEATGQIRQAEAGTGRHRPIVALTANAIKGDREKCLAAGMDEYVTKPIDPRELFRVIGTFYVSKEPPRANVNEVVPTQPPPPPSPGLPGEGAGAPVDLASLQERCLGNRALAAKLLGKFQTVLDHDVLELTQNLQNRNAPAVAATAHKIKGAAANASVEAVRSAALKLEQLAKADDLAQAEQCLANLQDEVSRFGQYLNTALEQLGSPAAAGKGGQS